MINDKIFKLHANCHPVKGAKRSIVCDLHYNTYKFIPNVLYEILTKYKNEPTGVIKSHFGNKYDQEIESYFEFLLENDLGFECSELEVYNYPDVDLLWEHPNVITNAILDFDINSNYNFENVINELDLLKCNAVEIRVFYEMEIDKLCELLTAFNSTMVKSIELIVGYDKNLEIKYLELCKNFPRLTVVTFYACDFEEIKDINHLGVTFIYVKKKIDSASHCGNINPAYFNVNLEMFLEALSFNSCLNRKISIDSAGFIKNCPSMSSSYGHSSEVKIIDIVNNEEFKAPWYITKNQVNVCRDCEFRYICTDCRAYTEQLAVDHNKPLKCSYNPYLAKWQDEY